MSPTIDTILSGDVERRPPPSTEVVPAIRAKDIYEVPRLAMQGLLAWTLPEAAWAPLSQLFAEIDVAVHPERTRAEMSQVAVALSGTRLAAHARHIAVANWMNRYEERFHYLRAWRFGGWTPDIRIIGGERVTEALAKGNGIVFWAGNFSFNDLIAKMAWHRLNLKVSHFSRPTHGFSDTRFGIRYLNAVRRGIEDRYLGERLMTELHETPAALQTMRDRLRANGCVSITVGNKGRRTAEARFFNARLVLATGPLALARATGAALLPVFSLRTGPGAFEVTIGEQLKLVEDAHGNAAYAAAVQSYADRVSPFVLRDPGQWRGWRYTRPLR